MIEDSGGFRGGNSHGKWHAQLVNALSILVVAESVRSPAPSVCINFCRLNHAATLISELIPLLRLYLWRCCQDFLELTK